MKSRDFVRRYLYTAN